MKKKVIIAVSIILVIIGVGAFLKFKMGSGLFKDRAQAEVRWETLGEYDYQNSVTPDSLKKFDGQYVKIPGFMVPLEDNSKKVTEFLLVPTPQACIHVPPPPPNQMLFAKAPVGVDVAFGPIWVHAIFHVKSKTHQYGEASFELEVKFIEPYL